MEEGVFQEVEAGNSSPVVRDVILFRNSSNWRFTQEDSAKGGVAMEKIIPLASKVWEDTRN